MSLISKVLFTHRYYSHKFKKITQHKTKKKIVGLKKVLKSRNRKMIASVKKNTKYSESIF